MKKLFLILILSLFSLVICSCSRTELPELKSPCVANENPFDVTNGTIPCVRRKVNDNWVV